MDISMIITLLSGVALFLFGMSLMGDGLKRVAGRKLETTLYKLTNTPIKGLLLGAGVTAVIQSSSATTVMVIGFVNSGMMKVAQSIGIIMGANIGTSITGWILCLSYIDGSSGIAQILSTATISAIVAIIGIILKMMCKKKIQHNIGDIMLGFAILMTGMQSMSSAVSPLKENPAFLKAMTTVSNPIIGILVGILFTAVLQSASASVGILQALSVTGGISLAVALPVTMGIGVGAACPVLISSIGTNKDGKRTALIYLLNDFFGMIFWSIVFYSANAVFHFSFLDMTLDPVKVALLNSVFRIATILVLLPFIKSIEKLVYWLVKDSPEDLIDEEDLRTLNDHLLDYPPLAISQCQQVVNNMASRAQRNILRSLDLFTSFTEEAFQTVQTKEDVVDRYEGKIGSFLTQLTTRSVTENQSNQISELLFVITDLECICDYSVHLARTAAELNEKKFQFSESAQKELRVLQSAIEELLELSVQGFITGNMEMVSKIEPLHELIDILCDVLKSHHIKRLSDGECALGHSFAYNEVLTSFERISAHCSNIAVALQNAKRSAFKEHEYVRSAQEARDQQYLELFHQFEQKYDLNENITSSVEITSNT